MNSLRRVVICVCGAAALTAAQAVPATAATASTPAIHALQIDPCELLGSILGDRC